MDTTVHEKSRIHQQVVQVFSHGRNDQIVENVENVQNLIFLPAYVYYIAFLRLFASSYTHDDTRCDFFFPRSPSTLISA
jgi:hypothetical protein